MKKRIYANACEMKMDNKRVIVEALDNKDIRLIFKIVCSKEESVQPSGLHFNLKNKAKVTAVHISSESALALYYALGQMLTLDNIPKEYLILE